MNLLVEYESFYLHGEVLVNANAPVANGSESLQGVRQTPVGGSVGAESSVAAAGDETVHEATLTHKSAGHRDDGGYGLHYLRHTKPSVSQSSVPSISQSSVPSIPQSTVPAVP